MSNTAIEKSFLAAACTVFLALAGWGGLSLNSLQLSYAGMSSDVGNIETNIVLMRDQQSEDIKEIRERIRAVERESYAQKQ